MHFQVLPLENLPKILNLNILPDPWMEPLALSVQREHEDVLFHF